MSKKSPAASSALAPLSREETYKVTDHLNKEGSLLMQKLKSEDFNQKYIKLRQSCMLIYGSSTS